MKRTFLVLAALLTATTLLITGCSRKEPPPSPLTATEILNKSSDAMQALSSFHFVLEQAGGGTPITMGIEMTGAEGDVVKPDKLQATVSGKAFGMSLEVKLVKSDQQTYMTNPLNGRWEPVPDDFSVLAAFDPGTGIASIIKGITTPARLGDGSVGSTASYRVKGSIDSDALRPITGVVSSGKVISVEVWIGKDDFLVRQVRLEGEIIEGEKEGIIRTLNLSDFNKQVSIKLPV